MLKRSTWPPITANSDGTIRAQGAPVPSLLVRIDRACRPRECTGDALTRTEEGPSCPPTVEGARPPHRSRAHGEPRDGAAAGPAGGPSVGAGAADDGADGLGEDEQVHGQRP